MDAAVIHEMRTNRYNESAKTLELTPAQVYGLEQVRAYWEKEFAQGDTRYGFLPNTVPTAQERKDIADFFFWTAWAAGTPRPGLSYTYTNNWPPDRSMGNVASTEALLWSLASIIAFLAVLGTVVYLVHRYGFFYGEAKAVEASYKLIEAPVTPSQRSCAKFFLVAGLLFIVQIFNGGLLAHYTVHPGTFYVEFIGQIYPVQLGQELAPAAGDLSGSPCPGWARPSTWRPSSPAASRSGQRAHGEHPLRRRIRGHRREPAGRGPGHQGLPRATAWFWLGHQGWEYLELGRLWQILLFGGLIFWLVVVYRGHRARAERAAPARPRRPPIAGRSSRSTSSAPSSSCAFFGFGLLYGRGTHLTMADYWRWFVVHIWVESIFEFFGVAVISLFLVTLGLVTAKSALRVAYFTAILVFISRHPGHGAPLLLVRRPELLAGHRRRFQLAGADPAHPAWWCGPGWSTGRSAPRARSSRTAGRSTS
ncbi:MAG: hypothetical protein MZV49_00280 [Rhodopseudomonas palustris]|nr:hypothetical protein [Rhodopseudomonas palustris]